MKYPRLMSGELKEMGCLHCGKPAYYLRWDWGQKVTRHCDQCGNVTTDYDQEEKERERRLES